MPSNMQTNPDPSENLNDGILDSRVSKVWELLGIKTFSPEATDKAFKVWQDDERYLIGYKGNKEDLGKDDFLTLKSGLEVWKSWNDTNTSSMLVLAGKNKRNDNSRCWFSPVAVLMAQAIREERETQNTSPGRPTCAVYQWKRRNSVFTMLLQVLHQLLDQNQHALKVDEAYDQISGVLKGFKEAVQVPNQIAESKDSGVDESLVETIGQTLLRVVDEFKNTGTIWIVLDRMDVEEAAPRMLAMRVLTKLVTESRATVRIWVVAERYGWTKFEEEIKGLVNTGEGKVISVEWEEEKGRRFLENEKDGEETGEKEI